MRARRKTHRPPPGWADRLIPFACLGIILAYLAMIDLKGISTDEGIRLGIINAGQPFVLHQPPSELAWDRVIETGQPFAYQPLYFLIQRTAMVLAQTQDVIFLRLVNVFFLWLSLQGMLVMSRGWPPLSRLFLLLFFGLNSYILMHVLQIREYIVAVAFYVWSSWLVLQLVDRRLGRSWPDCGWFAAYGFLLTAGFFTQAWVVFPAIGQLLFLVLTRKSERVRFYVHLAVSYLIVISATLPYLLHNRQKASVGRWGLESSDLLPQLSDGFHLVLTGHIAGYSWFTDLMFWGWIGFLLVLGWLWWRPSVAGRAILQRQPSTLVQAKLMLWCIGLSLVFQIGYFYKVENLSVWPRYFIIHSVFAAWLVALAFNHLHLLGQTRQLWRKVTAVVFAGMLASATYQVHSYYKDPTFDTGLTPTQNWRILANAVVRQLQPDDVLFTHEFINQATLTFTHPLTQRVFMLKDLEHAYLDGAPRIVYLEPVPLAHDRPALVARFAAKGFRVMEQVRLRDEIHHLDIDGWNLLVFRQGGGS